MTVIIARDSAGNSVQFEAPGASKPDPRTVATVEGKITGGGGGGGGAAIQPETGTSPIKISAFPAASLPMGSSDLVTGLQGGANVNFTQAQLLTGQSGVSSGDPGSAVEVMCGAGNGSGNGGTLRLYAGAGSTGGSCYLYAGNASGTNAAGGALYVHTGSATGANSTGGDMNFKTGNSNYRRSGDISFFTGTSGMDQPGGGMGFFVTACSGAGTGGRLVFHAGDSYSGAGGYTKITAGNSNTGAGGDFTIGPGLGTPNGHLLIQNLPTSAAGLPTGAVWNNSGVLNIV